MRTYHPIQRLERIHLHDIFTDERFWAGVAIVGFIVLFTILVIYSAKAGSTPSMLYYGPMPYMPYGPVPMR
jgi:hypothetical protein